ncbi:hypothetical protein C8J56DRAFT_1169620 [Mycena floridula]|nr:hypothetical protein C8J56DRAFT_1169620 [Mycena floridula]
MRLSYATILAALLVSSIAAMPFPKSRSSTGPKPVPVTSIAEALAEAKSLYCADSTLTLAERNRKITEYMASFGYSFKRSNMASRCDTTADNWWKAALRRAPRGGGSGGKGKTGQGQGPSLHVER